MVSKLNYPKVLIISNNPLSETSNNGKTLASFFDDYPSEKISQLYFSSEIPSSNNCYNYFKISDKDILESVVSKNKLTGKKVSLTVNSNTINSDAVSGKFRNIAKESNFLRLFREFFWKSEKWKSSELINWLDKISPEIIFFCAGDSAFAYDVSNSIQRKYNSKLAIYLTDDYILPRKTLNLFWWIRRNLILSKMKSTIAKSDSFFTISDKMKEKYAILFQKDSTVAINMVESLKEERIIKSSDVTTLVYAGGIHYKRYKTLHMLAKAIKKYNEEENNGRKVLLKIYSTQYISKKKKKLLNIENSSEFCGGVNSSELKRILNTCDIPVHVESFDKKSIESTQLSISTKIPEYLSLNKPILAIGPKNIASMQYIKNSAYCITEPGHIYRNFKKFINNENLQRKLSEKALQQYNDKHNKKNVAGIFVTELLKMNV